MSIREIPKSYVYTCDVCKTEHTQENAQGHYTNSRPPRWARLIFAQDAVDYQGQAVADGTVTLLLCDQCRVTAAELIDKLIQH